MCNIVLSIKQVSYRVAGSLIIDRINLQVKEKDFIVLVGSNGSGKSSLLKLINRQYLPSDGDVCYRGRDYKRFSAQQYAQRVVMLSQNNADHLCPGMTLYEHVRLYRVGGGGSGMNRRDLCAYLARFNRKFPQYLHRPVDHFSGGEKQMLVLALVLLRQPKLLLLDEHTAALDPKTSDEVMLLTSEVVKDLGVACIMATHQTKHIIPFGNRLIAISQGRVLQSLSGRAKQSVQLDHLLAACYN